MQYSGLNVSGTIEELNLYPTKKRLILEISPSHLTHFTLPRHLPL